MLRLRDLYYKEAISKLMKFYNYDNFHQVPKLLKIVLNIGVGEAVSNTKAIKDAEKDLMLISGQYPLIIKAKCSVAAFKLRRGMPIGCKVTLRRERMYDFLERLVYVVLPRISSFRGFLKSNFDGRGNLNFGIKEQVIFPEIKYDDVNSVRGVNVTIVTSTCHDEHAAELLKILNLPFYDL